MRKKQYFIGWLAALTVVLAALLIVGLYVGAREISWQTVGTSFIAFDGDDADMVVVQSVRRPRLIAALLCGVNLAVAGALMQGITNNPMASPSIMGINAGAALGLAVAMIALPEANETVAVLCAAAGAAVATAVIMGLARLKGRAASPVFLALAGTAVGAVAMSLTQALTVYFDVAQEMSYWTAGGIGGVRMEQVRWLWPWSLVGVALALRLAAPLTLLSFGDETAVGLGGNTRHIRIWSAVAVLLLSGSAVAVAGPVGFVGLITPHMARYLGGAEYTRIIPLAGLLGGILLVAADTVARTAAAPFEIPLGAITALLGVPFFLYLANRRGGRL